MCALCGPDSGGFQEERLKMSEYRVKDIFSFGNIHRCYLACRKNKRNTVNALKFEINAEENLLKLEKELKHKTYRPSRSILFATRKPKLREIFAADFRDRVVHHVLVDYLERIWEKIFIHDSYACRKDRGTHKAVMRLRDFLRKISRSGKRKAYYLQLDIKDFFTAIDKDILFGMIKKESIRQGHPLAYGENHILGLHEVFCFEGQGRHYKKDTFKQEHLRQGK